MYIITALPDYSGEGQYSFVKSRGNDLDIPRVIRENPKAQMIHITNIIKDSDPALLLLSEEFSRYMRAHDTSSYRTGYLIAVNAQDAKEIPAQDLKGGPCWGQGTAYRTSESADFWFDTLSRLALQTKRHQLEVTGYNLQGKTVTFKERRSMKTIGPKMLRDWRKRYGMEIFTVQYTVRDHTGHEFRNHKTYIHESATFLFSDDYAILPLQKILLKGSFIITKFSRALYPPPKNPWFVLTHLNQESFTVGDTGRIVERLLQKHKKQQRQFSQKVNTGEARKASCLG